MIKNIMGGASLGALLLAGAASAQTGTSSIATSTTTTTPGVPNTGADMTTLVILALSAAIAIGGAIYLYSSRRA